MCSELTFKVASEAWELDQINRLNYRTFVEEIPQHAQNPDASLVDKFNDQNTYFICLRGRELLGMMAVRDSRPFSLDEKLPDLDSYLPPARSICEIRLLSVAQGHRNGRVFRGLGRQLIQHSLQKGYDLAVISGTISQEKLYRHLGFKPFGPLVGKEEARFQPMYMNLDAFNQALELFE